MAKQRCGYPLPDDADAAWEEKLALVAKYIEVIGPAYTELYLERTHYQRHLAHSQ